MMGKKSTLFKSFIVFALILVSFVGSMGQASAETAEEVIDFEEPSIFTEFSDEVNVEVIEEVSLEDEEVDLTGLSQEEVNALSDDDYIEYQMQSGNYTIEEDGTVVIPDQRVVEGQMSIMCIACTGGSWRVKKLSGETTVYGSWRTIASGWGPGSLSQTISETRSNSYSGTLSASKSAVSAAVGYNISTSKTVSVTYTGDVARGKQGFLQTRPVYKRHTVKQEYVKIGKVVETKYVYPRKFVWTDSRIGY